MTMFDDFLADPKAKRQELLTLEGYDGSAVVPVYVSTHGFNTTPTDSPANRHFQAALTWSQMSRSMFSGANIGGFVKSDYGSVRFVNSDSDPADRFDFLRTYGFDGRRITRRYGGILGDGTVMPYSEYGIIFDGTSDGDAIVGEKFVEVRLRDDSQKFMVPIQTNLYRGMSHCLAFDGVNDYVDLNSNTSVADCAFSCWFRCDGANTLVTDQHIAEFEKGFGTADIDWLLYLTAAGNVTTKWHRAQVTPLTIATTGYDYKDTLWHHVAIRASGGVIYLYVDRVLVGSGTSPTFAAITGNLFLGSHRGAVNFFKGRIDECPFSRVDRTASWLVENADRELADPVAAELFSYHKLNDNTGTATDSSGNGKTGTLNGATWASSLSGFADLAHKPLPLCYGEPGEFEPVCVDPGRLIYQAHDRLANAVITVWVAGAPMILTTDYTVQNSAAGCYFTLVNNPAGKVTCRVQGDATGSYVNTHAGIMRRIAARHAGLVDPTDFDTTAFDDAASEKAGPAGVYVWSDTVLVPESPEESLESKRGAQGTVMDVLNELASSAGFFHGFVRATRLYTVAQFEAVSGSPVASFDSKNIMGPLVPTAQGLVYWRVIVAYARNYAVQSAEDVVTIITSNSERFSAATNEWRYAVAQDASVKVRNPLARELVIYSAYLNYKDAQAKADADLLLWKERHDMYEVPLRARPLALDVNQVVTLTRDRFDLDAGEDFRILGFKEQSGGRCAVQVWR